MLARPRSRSPQRLASAGGPAEANGGTTLVLRKLPAAFSGARGCFVLGRGGRGSQAFRGRAVGAQAHSRPLLPQASSPPRPFNQPVFLVSGLCCFLGLVSFRLCFRVSRLCCFLGLCLFVSLCSLFLASPALGLLFHSGCVPCF